MLKGLEISEVLISKVKNESYSHRWDSNYFSKEFLFSPLANINTEIIGNLFDITSGTTPRDRDETLKKGVILLKTNDIRNNILKDKGDSFFYIDKESNSKMSSSQLKANDVLINIVGATTDVIGRVSYVSESFPKANITQAMSLMRSKQSKITSYYLFCFLLSNYGNMQVRRFARQTGQFNMNHSELGGFEIPLLSLEFQQKLRTLVLNNNLSELKSQKLYSQAKSTLLKAIGLQNFESKQTNNFQEINLSKSFSSTTRLDAEYYHPKPLFLIDQLKKKEYFLVKELFDIGNGYAWKSKYFKEQGEGEPFVRIRNCKPGYIDNENLTTLDSDYAKGEEVEKANKNDIVIGMDGIRYFYGSLIKKPVYVNQRVCHLTPKEDSEIDSELILMIINSVIGQTQLMREMTIAQTVGHITNASVGNLIIPKLDEKIRNEVSEKIKESHKLEKESLHLLEVAKKAVEIAIEENEENAIKFINSNTSEYAS